MEDTDRLDAWRGVLLAQARVVASIESDLADAGVISLSWYDVLLELNAAPDLSLRMQDLGERVVLSRSRVSRIVDELEREGLAERRPDPTDGRATLAHITRTGRSALRRAAPVYPSGIERHFTAHLTDAERQHIAAGLARIIAHQDGPRK